VSAALRATFKNPSLRVSALAIFFFGTTGAAVSPYQSIIGIQELGLSDSGYALLMLAAAVINVTASVMMGIFSDRLGNYRTSIVYVSLFGIAGFGIVYLLASAPAFVVSKLILLPVFGALNSLIFANVRASSAGLSASALTAVNSTMRATISLSWVLMPGLVGLMLMKAPSMLPAYLVATASALVCFGLALWFLPHGEKPIERHHEDRYKVFASLGEVMAPRVLLRVLAISLICSMLYVSDTVRPLIVTGKAGGTVADLGIIVGIVAFLEIIFIIVWGKSERYMRAVTALAFGASLYVVYMVLQGLSTATWHVYAQTILSGIAAAAIISLPITYLQDLIADRPGLGSSLIAVNMFLSAGLSAVVFAIGTRIGEYGATSILSAALGLAGVVLLIVLDGGARKRMA
jgi:MFS transporter, SET family, sugar efflux transporter